MAVPQTILRWTEKVPLSSRIIDPLGLYILKNLEVSRARAQYRRIYSVFKYNSSMRLNSRNSQTTTWVIYSRVLMRFASPGIFQTGLLRIL